MNSIEEKKNETLGHHSKGKRTLDTLMVDDNTNKTIYSPADDIDPSSIQEGLS